MSLIQALPENPLDIIGDIHGEYTALLALLARLGYNKHGQHRKDRKLVFVGDLCDRGPDSLAVIKLVEQLIRQGNAQAILGNHEINLLANDPKDGSGWFFDERYEPDKKNYAPFRRTPASERQRVRDFLQNLPMALQRADIRIVHAAWNAPAISAISVVPLGQITRQFHDWDNLTKTAASESGLYERYLYEKKKWAKELEDEQNPPPYLHAIAEYEAMEQMYNPLKVLTSGVERQTNILFFSGNRWRFSDRISWWDDYEDEIPVVIGHYWRLFQMEKGKMSPRYSQLFNDIAPTAWHGKNNKVFCIDYSAGARWRDRKVGRSANDSNFKLAALQWPENQVVFDTGEMFPTY